MTNTIPCPQPLQRRQESARFLSLEGFIKGRATEHMEMRWVSQKPSMMSPIIAHARLKRFPFHSVLADPYIRRTLQITAYLDFNKHLTKSLRLFLWVRWMSARQEHNYMDSKPDK